MQYKDTYVYNLFFGCLVEQPIKFDYTFTNLKDINGQQAHVFFELFNDRDHFPVEKDFLEFNSLENKQKIGHNFRACANTGYLRIIYPYFDSDDSYAYTEKVNLFLQLFVTYLLTFYQRRRVIFGCPKLTSGDRIILTIPPFAAGEFIDSIGYGEPLVPYSATQECLTNAIATYANFNELEKKHIEMLLMRYNETLNLPYSYERVEAFWRILEALGNSENFSEHENEEYERIKAVIGIKKNSGTLKKFLKTLIDHGLTYTNDEIKDSFDFRNKTTHEYLNSSIVEEPYLSSVFRFLNICIELVILSILKIDRHHYVEPSYSLIQNRVL
ncbi:hypothetical protein NDI49_27725 [Trichocoleus sp. ST-U3]|uniref:hypothetical protein n=1 Tax=Coleofasciculus sp. FACHB-542 TaxID=2692787 RepID=UPI001683F285|nr:hypothetical protein [Coleofasciculus sp. FACHB-542]MBD2085957.1 hypothetical protein [Coleofasciculus sp. FACHB-542]